MSKEGGGKKANKNANPLIATSLRWRKTLKMNILQLIFFVDSDSDSSSSDEDSRCDVNESSRDSAACTSNKGEEEGAPKKRRKLNLDETEIRIPLEHG